MVAIGVPNVLVMPARTSATIRVIPVGIAEVSRHRPCQAVPR